MHHTGYRPCSYPVKNNYRNINPPTEFVRVGPERKWIEGQVLVDEAGSFKVFCICKNGESVMHHGFAADTEHHKVCKIGVLPILCERIMPPVPRR